MNQSCQTDALTDLPLTDILNHGMTIYGRETDDVIREIHKIAGMQATYDWWVNEFTPHEDDETKRNEVANEFLKALKEGAS